MSDTAAITIGARYIDEATQSYLQTILDSESCRGYLPGCDDEDCDRSYAENGFTVDDFSQTARDEAHAEIERFVSLAPVILSRYEAEQVGYDLWMTRAGHGCGFWDGDYEAVSGDGRALTDIVHEHFPERYGYIGDDGAVHVQ